MRLIPGFVLWSAVLSSVGCAANENAGTIDCGFGTWDYEQRRVIGIRLYAIDRLAFVRRVLPRLRGGDSMVDAVPLVEYVAQPEWPLVGEVSQPWVNSVRARDWLACNLAEAIGEPFWVDTLAPPSVREEAISRLLRAADLWLLERGDEGRKN